MRVKNTGVRKISTNIAGVKYTWNPAEELLFSDKLASEVEFATDPIEDLNVVYGDNNLALADLNVIYHEITNAEFLAKQVTLDVTPANPSEIIIDIINSGPQQTDKDYIILGPDIIWAGRGWDGEIEEGDVLRIQYFSD